MEAMDIINFLGLFMIIILLGALLMTGITEFYINPTAAETANTQCRILGFDQYKSFKRVGVFSTVPVAIQCEYSERYSNLGVRTE